MRLNAAFLRSPYGWPYLLVPLIPAAVAFELLHASAGLVFVAAALGIIPTAALMGRATEELAARSGPVRHAARAVEEAARTRTPRRKTRRSSAARNGPRTTQDQETSAT